MPLIHPLLPVYDAESQILILGSFPSVKSRETGFYYGHAQNRFWRVMASLFEDMDLCAKSTIEEKTAFLHRHHIALYDVIAACEITGSADSTIHHVVPTNLSGILHFSPIRRIFCNGNEAYRLFMKYQSNVTTLPVQKLPSTSPANAAWQIQRLREAWSAIL